ncbi:hypothetical protein BJ138DRAFT_1103594 [Hygrophoropsis aurantiaca]|uniref:Uncharacterized protein n=1 Tax=Hygrophoropsis aurantiaca TaxID=72124 RepID=A0ACB8A5M1_9AGAM|nr:hypothetical protein BJ138DRAFT_1103594 [Hygrophoropsis aurantiaca]
MSDNPPTAIGLGPVDPGLLKTGLYIITYAETSGFAALANDNNGSAVSQWTIDPNTVQEIPADIKWNFTLLDNGNYTIASYPYGNFATVTASPRHGDVVKGRPKSHEWIIRTSKLHNQGLYLYLVPISAPSQSISPDDNDSLYWGFSSNSATQVKMTDSADTLWMITPVDP